MSEAALSNRPKRILGSFASTGPKIFHGSERAGSTQPANGGCFLRAAPVRECGAEDAGVVEVWKYAFPLGANQPVENIRVRLTTGKAATASNGTQWTGIFECARGRHVDVMPWSEANAVVVAAASAVYIVDPSAPEHFSGFAAPVEINGVTFDESRQHMFVADSVRIYAFSSDRLLRWISEPLHGYGARFRGCGGRVLAVELKQCELESEGEEPAPSVIRLRTEDGTILRSRFRLARRYWMKTPAV